MKKIIFITFLLCFITGFGQNQVAKKIQELENQRVNFSSFSVFTPSKDIDNSMVNNVVEKATLTKINLNNVNAIFNNKFEFIELAIPYNNEMVIVNLYKVNPFAEGFHIDTDKEKSIPYEKGVYYRGIVKGDYTSVASFNFFNNELNGIISSNLLSNLVIGKLDKPNNVSDYIIYSDANLKILNTFNCSFKDDNSKQMNLDNTNRDVNTVRCVTMYFEIDYNLFQSNANSTTQTTNWMTSLFNNVQTLYTNDSITISLKSLYIWTTPDPYDGVGTSSSDYLFLFNELRPVFDGDVGQLVGMDEGGLGGVAVDINGLCTQNNFSYSDVFSFYDTVPVFSWNVEVIAHEMGHLLGSRHTHGCWWNGNNTAIDGCGQQAGYNEGNCPQGPIPTNSVKGTIMSYCHLVSAGINFNNGFGPQPRTAIQNAVNSGACLSTDCINTCINTVYNLNFTSIATNSAVITWADSSTFSSWQVSVFPFGETATTWATVSTNSYTANGLNPNTHYVVQVRPNCTNGLASNGNQIIFVTASTFCSGTTLSDSGGPTNNYTDMETVIRILIPNLPNKTITLTFSAFSLELDYDYLYIYDGNSTSAVDLSGGGFTGGAIPPPLTSTAIDGSLTIKFFSDGGVVDAGYVATTSCSPNLGTTQFDGIDFSYYPNPTNGKVVINSKTEINDVAVYSIQGQLLYQNKLNDLNTSVDISSYANGTYFFKLKFGEKEVNFKILKM